MKYLNLTATNTTVKVSSNEIPTLYLNQGENNNSASEYQLPFDRKVII